MGGILEAKVKGTVDAAWVECCKYVQMAELCHNPWDMMFCRDILLLKQKVAADLLNVWKPWPDSGMER